MNEHYIVVSKEQLIDKINDIVNNELDEIFVHIVKDIEADTVSVEMLGNILRKHHDPLLDIVGGLTVETRPDKI